MQDSSIKIYWNLSQALLWIMFRDKARVDKADDQGGRKQPEVSPVLEVIGPSDSALLTLGQSCDELFQTFFRDEITAFLDGNKLDALWWDGSSIDYYLTAETALPRVVKPETEALEGRPFRILASDVMTKWPRWPRTQLCSSPYDDQDTAPFISLYEVNSP